MQTIASEFNLSETTFVLPPEDAANDARVRIFTPKRELAFAGHPVIGTALALREAGKAGDDILFELAVGTLPVRVNGRRARFETRVPLSVNDGPPAEKVAAASDLGPEAVRTERHAPVTAGLGNDFVLVELSDLAALEAAKAVPSEFDGETTGLYLYVRDGSRIRARMFAPLAGIPEDPATGSAAAALAAYLGKLEGRTIKLKIVQGVEMGRPSLIETEATIENGAPVAVTVAGTAVRVAEGRLLG